MAVRKIYIWPDPVLSTVAKPVVEFDQRIRALVADMFDTMYASDGIGLAANQIGVSLQVLVVDLDPHHQAPEKQDIQDELSSWLYQEPVVLMNPTITKAEGSIIWTEGCLSVPDVNEDIERKAHIWVQAYNAQGQVFELEARGLFAVAIQHEMDHLAGRVFVDYLSRLKRDVIKKKMLKRQSETIL